MSVEVGTILEGKVVSIMPFGAFISLPEGKTGLVHISEVAVNYVKDVSEHLKQGQTVKVKVIKIDEKGKISLSIKKAIENNTPKKPAAKTSVRPIEIDWSRNNDANLKLTVMKRCSR